MSCTTLVCGLAGLALALEKKMRYAGTLYRILGVSGTCAVGHTVTVWACGPGLQMA
jgi:hypothetical protein